MGAKIDLTGQVFGRLTAIKEHAERGVRGEIRYECRCSCGNEDIVIKNASSLRVGDTKSCGCLQRENALRQSVNNTGVVVTHGMTNSKTYIAWRNMKARCDDLNHPAYVNYGGRGISYPDSWARFEGFLEEMGEQPENLTLNRKDVNLNYSKENCEWVDNYKQGRDRRKPSSGQSSPYKGVSFNKAENKYKASVRYKGIIYHLGYSSSALELALKYDEKVIELTGSNAGTNEQLGLL
jgi:hypothetical protein